MEINVTMVVVIILLALAAARGCKNGLIQEIISVFTFGVLAVVLLLIATGISSYLNKSYMQVILVLMLVVIVGIAMQLTKILFGALKALSKVPVINWINKIGGLVLGLAECVIFVWAALIIMVIFESNSISQYFIHQVSENTFLLFIYEHNYLAQWIIK